MEPPLDIALDTVIRTHPTEVVLVGRGLYANVYKVRDVAVKVHHHDGDHHDIEKRIYERLGHSPYIVRYYGESPIYSAAGRGIMMEYYAGGILSDNLIPNPPSSWVIDAAEALKHCHSNGVIHGDIGSHNFFLKRSGRLVLGDFGGSRMDGSPCYVLSATRYTRPSTLGDFHLHPLPVDDIFALGGVLYEITAGKRLYAEKMDSEIREAFSRDEFPDLSYMASNIRFVIQKCWKQEYRYASQVIADLRAPGSPSRVLGSDGGEMPEILGSDLPPLPESRPDSPSDNPDTPMVL